MAQRRHRREARLPGHHDGGEVSAQRSTLGCCIHAEAAANDGERPGRLSRGDVDSESASCSEKPQRSTAAIALVIEPPQECVLKRDHIWPAGWTVGWDRNTLPSWPSSRTTPSRRPAVERGSSSASRHRSAGRDRDRHRNRPRVPRVGLVRRRRRRGPHFVLREREIYECGTSFFVPEEQARGLVSGAIPRRRVQDWETFQRSNGGLVANESVVQVSIQGESSRTVTLTGIDFTVDRRPRPPGATFCNPCGDSIYGRYVVADLDREPVVLAGTADDPEAVLDPSDPVSGAAQSTYRPISFPWEVSVTDPFCSRSSHQQSVATAPGAPR